MTPKYILEWAPNNPFQPGQRICLCRWSVNSGCLEATQCFTFFFLPSPLTSVSNLCRNPEPPVTTEFLRWLLPGVTADHRRGPILKFPLTSPFYLVHKEILYQNLSDPWTYKIFPFNRTQCLQVERDAHYSLPTFSFDA